MNEEFLKSVGNIRQVSLDMLKNLRAVRGENYARVVHSIILCDQIDLIIEVFQRGATEGSKEMADSMQDAASKMLTRVMEYYIRSTGFSEAQVKEAFEEADRIQRTAEDLVSKAADMADQGQVMGE